MNAKLLALALAAVLAAPTAFAVDTGRIHLFDKDTERYIIH